MKIAIVISGMGKGGGERVVSVLSNRFTNLGNEVTIIITGDSTECVYNLDPRINIIGLKDWIKDHPISQTILGRIKKKFRKFFVKQSEFEKCYRTYKNGSDMLVAYLKENPMDYALSFLVHDNMALALCSKRQNAKIIICEGTYPDRPDYSNIFKLVRDKCYVKSDYRVFQTEEQMKLFPAKMKRNSTVIGNPLAENLPLPFKGRRSKVIVNFCRLDKPKNLFLLIDAFCKLVKEYPDYKLNIYGDGPLHSQLEEKIIQMNMQNNVFLFSFQNNLHELIKNSTMFVTSSDFEGLSNSLLEAMAIGLPVIATDCLGGGARCLINNGKNGLLVAKGDEQALYAAMKRYIDSPSYAETCGQNAKEIRYEYSVENITNKWLDLFTKI